jgi:hypothetical protein
LLILLRIRLRLLVIWLRLGLVGLLLSIDRLGWAILRVVRGTDLGSSWWTHLGVLLREDVGQRQKKKRRSESYPTFACKGFEWQARQGGWMQHPQV